MSGSILIGIFISICGLAIGSFLNVCIYRIPRNESIAFPPSHCTSCNSRIKWYDLIPVLSYIFLKGSCRSCKSKISLRYPLIEVLNGALYLLLYLKFGLSFSFIKYAFLISLIIVVSLIDIDTTDVYFKTSLVGFISAGAFILFSYFAKYDASILNSILGAAAGGGFILFIYFVTKGKGMGLGDAEICAYCGAFLGFKLAIAMLFFSVVLGGIIGIFLIALKIKGRKDYIPFGPYIALGTLISIFMGLPIISWYLGSFIS